jgi:hypothetical protein
LISYIFGSKNQDSEKMLKFLLPGVYRNGKVVDGKSAFGLGGMLGVPVRGERPC